MFNDFLPTDSHQKMFSQEAARRRFSRIFVQKKFWPPFWIFLQPFSFSKKYEYFCLKIILQNGKIFIR
jgi:hypothetical protein